MNIKCFIYFCVKCRHDYFSFLHSMFPVTNVKEPISKSTWLKAWKKEKCSKA